MYDPVVRPKASKVIEDNIRMSIIGNKLRPGDRLASEKELAESFAVSRQTLREALSALESLGLVELRKGSGGGAYVAQVPLGRPQKSLIDFLYTQGVTLTSEHVGEARLLVEPHAARMAACLITPDQKDALVRTHAAATARLDQASRAELQPLETAFHRCIAVCIPNPLVRFLCTVLSNIVEEANMRHCEFPQDLSRKVNAIHGDILQAILDGDPDAAEKAMHADLALARTIWEKIYRDRSLNGKKAQTEWVVYGDRVKER